MKKRILSLFLALVLCLSLVPAAGAAETGQTDGAAASAAAPETEAAQPQQEQPAVQDTASLMSGESDSRDVAVFIPYYGKQDMFTLQAYYSGVQLADAMGGTCHVYLGKDATLKALADAFTTCRIIIIHTHGSDGHISLEDAFPDGEEILYNVHGKIVTELLFLGTCEGMKTEDMEKPMRDAGVEVVFGWSQSVKTSTDHLCISYFTDGLLRGMTAGEAIEYMKEEYCSFYIQNTNLHPSYIQALEQMGKMPWDFANSYSLTEEEARKNHDAFAILVSRQDPYPGIEHKDEVQTAASAWKLPVNEEAGRNIRAWGRAGAYFSFFFPDAEEFSLLSGTLPPGIELEYSDFGRYKSGHKIPFLTGIPTQPGQYEATLKVTLENGTTEPRRITILVAEEEIAQSMNSITLQPGQDQALPFYSAGAGGIFQAERINGDVPPGLTFFNDGGTLRYRGSPTQTGSFSATYRVVLTSGKVVDHTVNVTVPAQYGVSSENLSLFVGAGSKTFLNFEGVEQVRTMQLVNGELPPGITLQYNMSEAPNYSGTPEKSGTYSAAFRVALLNGKTVTHLVTAVVRSEAPYLDTYPMDLSLGETCIPKEDVDTWLFRTFFCAAYAGQIKMDSSAQCFDLDKDGTWDIRWVTKSDGSVAFSLMDNNSLLRDKYNVPRDDYPLNLNDAAVAEANSQWKADHSKKYAKSISFHLNTPFDLYVAGTQVGTQNREDILGNGVFSFDGVNTLFIHGDYGYSGTEPLIKNGIDGLIIQTDADIEQPDTPRSLTCWGNCIETNRSLSLTGTGSLRLRSTTGSGIVCDNYVLTVFNTSLMIQANQGKGIIGTGENPHARLNRANLRFITGEGAMDGFSSIGMYGCAVSDPVRGDKGTIGGYLCLVDENKTPLTNAQITAYDTKYDLTIDGIPVTDRNRADVLRDGTFSFDGDHTLTVSKSFAGTERLKPVIESKIDGLVIQAAPDTVLSSKYMTCVSLEGTTTLTGGPLTVISESKYGQGLLLDQDVSLLVSDMALTVQGGRNGIRGSAGSGKLVLSDNASVTASGATAAIQVPGGLERCMVETPAGGSIQSGKVVDSGGTPAKEAVLRFFKEYDLMINGNPVTSQNMSDLGPSFSFDGDRTLTVRGDCRSEYNIIENGMDGLVIYVEKDAVLSTEPEYEWSTPIGTPLFTGADLTITGPGKLTLLGGINHGLSAAYGAAVTVKDANLAANTVIGASSGTSLVLDNATVACGTLMGFDGGITLKGCAVVSPAGGTVKDGTVVGPDEAAAAEVVIAPAEISVHGDIMTYSLYLPGSGAPASLIAAWYDENGKMLGCTAVNDVPQDGMKTGTIKVKKDQKEYRFFALDGGSAAPLIRALTTKE